MEELKQQIAHLIEKFGYEAVAEEVVSHSENIKPLDGSPPTCPTGYVWSASLGKCVLDGG